MTISLEEALAGVELEAGRTYRCQVRGQLVEVRILGSAVAGESTNPPETLAPTEAWIELPTPVAIGAVRARLMPPDPPDVPHIPEDGETA